jgi:hypothetical protein
MNGLGFLLVLMAAGAVILNYIHEGDSKSHQPESTDYSE